jgi:hypothetical protein
MTIPHGFGFARGLYLNGTAETFSLICRHCTHLPRQCGFAPPSIGEGRWCIRRISCDCACLPRPRYHFKRKPRRSGAVITLVIVAREPYLNRRPSSTGAVARIDSNALTRWNASPSPHPLRIPPISTRYDGAYASLTRPHYRDSRVRVHNRIRSRSRNHPPELQTKAQSNI